MITPAVKKKKSSSRPHLHVYGAAHNSGALGLSGPAVRTERLLSGSQMSPNPRRTICRFLQVGVAHGRVGGAGGGSAEGGQPGWVLAGLGRLWSRRGGHLVARQLPSGLLFSLMHLAKLFVNRLQRGESSPVWVQRQPPAPRRNNEVCATHQFLLHFVSVA